ncbi:MAG: 5'-nucleotidase [Gammaproteobacteria bacterium]|nr:5'-nucleotidase [Gammaproteobacteria bacterium]
MNEKKLVVAISSRALFDLEAAHEIFERNGVDAYCQYQIEHEAEVLGKGVAFPLVEKLLKLNNPDDGEPGDREPDNSEMLVEVILLSKNSADTGLRVFNSIEHYQLGITRAAFAGGETPYRYVRPFGAHLFLSADPEDVTAALDSGLAAATILPSKANDSSDSLVRIAFDGDAVLFSDEAEQIYQKDGLAEFEASEKASAEMPLPGGPFKGFLAALHNIQSHYPAKTSPIRTALVTARCAPAHERVIKTLRAWDIRIDEALFLGGMPKGEFLAAYGADLFVDDQKGHCEVASEFVLTGHVPNGITNEDS